MLVASSLNFTWLALAKTESPMVDCNALLHTEANSRPKCSPVLNVFFFTENSNSLWDRDVAINMYCLAL